MIYLFDQYEKLIRVVNEPSIRSLSQREQLTDEHYVSDTLTAEIENFTEKEFDEVEYVAVPSREDKYKYQLYFVLNYSRENNVLTFDGVASGAEELKKTPVYNLRPRNRPLTYVAGQLLEETNWTLGYTADVGTRSAHFYYTNAFEALKLAAQTWGVEFQFFVEINNNRIGNRFIEFHTRVGGNYGARVTHGHNALQLLSETSKSELYTALIGRGKGEEVSGSHENESGQAGYGRKINFADVEWRFEDGDPVDKPLGQEYVELPQATEAYGIKTPDGMKPKIGFVEFSEQEDKEQLLRDTYAQLLTTSRPQRMYKASANYVNIRNIGDTIRVEEPDKRIDYETRVFDITWDRLTGTAVDIKLGDYLVNSNRKQRERVQNAARETISNEIAPVAEAVTYAVTSANGKNTNYHGSVEPDNPRVGDLWFRPHPDFPSETLGYIWNGEIWEEWANTHDQNENKRAIEALQPEVESAKANADKAVAEIDTAITNAGFTSLDETISHIQTSAADALTDARNSITTANEAAATAQSAIGLANDLSGQVSDFELTVNGFTQTVNDYEGQVSQFRNDVNGLNSTVASYETQLDAYGREVGTYATQVATFSNTVAGLDSTVARYREDVQGYDAQVSTLTNTVNGFNSTVTRVESQYSELNRTVSSHTSSIENLDGRVALAATKTEAQGYAADAVDGLEIGGRNYYSDDIALTPIGVTGFRRNEGDSVNGFQVTGTSGNDGYVRLNDVLDGKGHWTVSFEFRGTQNVSVSLTVNIAGVDSKFVRTTNDNTWSRVEFTANVTNDNKYVLFQKIAFAHFRIRNIKVERGTKATGFSLAPEQTQAQIASVSSQLTVEAGKIEALTTRVSGTETLVNSVKQTADANKATISSHTGQISSIQQNVNGLQTTVANKADSSTVTQLSDAFNVLVTREDLNLVSNGDFENGLTGWETGGTGANVELSTTQMDINGQRSRVLVAYKTTTNTNTSGNDDRFWSSGWQVQKGRKYRVKLKARTFGPRRISIGQSGGDYMEMLTLSDNWETYEVIYEASGTSAFSIYIHEGGTYYFDDIEIYETTAISSGQISVLSNNINLRVRKGDVLSQINVEAGRTLIQSDKLLLNANSVVFSGGAFIPNAAIESLNADKITTGTLNAANVNIINLNVNNLAGNRSEFVRSAWNGVSTTVSIDGTGILTRSNDSNVQTRIRDGIMEFRDSTPNVVGALGTSEHLSNEANRVVKGLEMAANYDKYLGWVKQWRPGSAFERVMDTSVVSPGLNIWVSTSVRNTLNMQGNEIHNVDRMYLGDTVEGLIRIPSENANLLTARGGVRIAVGDVGANGHTTRLHVMDGRVRVNTDLEVEGFTLLKNTLNMNRKEIHAVERIYLGSTTNGLMVDSGRPYLNGSGGVLLGYNSSMRVEVLNSVTRFHRSIDLNNNSLLNQSDRRLKKNIVDTSISALQNIRDTRFVEYEWISSESPSGVHLGVIAQETPWLVEDPTADVLAINTSRQIMYNSLAIQEVDSNVIRLGNRIEEVDAFTQQALSETAALRQRVDELERELKNLKGAA